MENENSTGVENETSQSNTSGTGVANEQNGIGTIAFDTQPVVQKEQVIESNKTSVWKNKKFLFVIVMPIVVMGLMGIFIFSKMDTKFIAQSKYELTYIPDGWNKGKIEFSTNPDGEKSYQVQYTIKGGGIAAFSQVYNPTDFNCTRSLKAGPKIGEYMKFLPDGAIDGCVHSFNSPEDKLTGKVYQWMKDGIAFSLNLVNNDLNDEEALKIANSVQLNNNINK